jgi:hypothetical protein
VHSTGSLRWPKSSTQRAIWSTFETLFARLDSALERSDAQAVNVIVSGIVDVAKSSPLADLGDLGKIRAALDDPDQVWDL